MNEVITLRFVEYDSARAEIMLRWARLFAVSNPLRMPGMRGGTVFTAEWHVVQFRAVAYWTKARAIVVREIGPNGEVA